MDHTLLAKAAGTASEDVAGVRSYRDGLFIVLADGAGGMSGGRSAALACVDELCRFAETDRDLEDLLPVLGDLDLRLMKERDAGETAVLAFSVTPGHIAGASAGDSECWVFTNRDASQVTAGQHRKPLLGSGECVVLPFE